MTDKESFLEVAVEAPIFEPLTYSSNLDLKEGTPVRVPLGSRIANGVVLNKTSKKSFKLKSIENVREDLPIIAKPYLDWATWLSSYYVYPIGQVFKNATPNLKKKTQKTSVLKPPKKEVVLNESQKNIVDSIKLGSFDVHLIHGITGSGKTEIYLSLIEKVKDQVLVLVPEISLTPQLVLRFRQKFLDDVSVIHSRLTDRERTNQWWDVIDKKNKILIGARSAIFCPIQKIDLIIIDEEHDASFKQNEGFRYNAKHAGIMLAKLHDCPIILGSATPSVESWFNTKKNYKLHSLLSRFGGARLPKVILEDMKKDQDESLPSWLSKNLFDKMNEHLDSNHQVALFLNRRGQSYLVCCSECGEQVKCPNCSVSLIRHGDRYLVCHYCNYHKNFDKCDYCDLESLKVIGIGTEGIQKDLEKLYPNHKIIRADRDVISNNQQLNKFIKTVEQNEADILVGTQMISKGLNFPNLTLVGIVSLDMSMNMPDFRSEEKTFQLLLQVSGRAGRYGSQSEVVIQTFKPQDEILKMATNYEYESFFKRELEIRKALYYPPFGRLAMIRGVGISEKRVVNTMKQIAVIAKEIRSNVGWFDILGPAPSPISKLRGKYRYQSLLKAKRSTSGDFKRDINLNEVCFRIKDKLKRYPGVRLSFDIDPMHTL